ncbi:DUF362 domain-containing protein [Candidatus Latescibacterota bacterium]
MKRRDFIKKSVAASAALTTTSLFEMTVPEEAQAINTGGGIGIQQALYMLEKGKEKNTIPVIRPEILNNPRAVFLIETHVDARRDADGFFTEAAPQIENAGKDIVSSIFVKGEQKGGSTLVKPNFTYVDPTHINRTSGVITRPDFLVGFVKGMKELGNSNIMLGERNVNAAYNHRKAGIYEVLDYSDGGGEGSSPVAPLLEAENARFEHYEKNDLNWRTIKNSVISKKMPFWRPIGDEDCFVINIAALKTHDTSGTTLGIKNLQGAVPTGYGHFCSSWATLPFNAKYWGIDFKRSFHKDYHQGIEDQYSKHLTAGFKHWDYEKSYQQYLEKGGWDAFRKIKDDRKAIAEFTKGMRSLMSEEKWLQLGLDCASAMKPGLNIIDGIIGLDGSAHGTCGTDTLCNIVVAGLSVFEVDAVGNYIMGHDPSEMWYTRVAKERGLGECDINKIDIYIIRNGEITPVKNLAEIKRFHLGTNLHSWGERGIRLMW